ncbi:uncharacterized protein [Antedon mediterranea]|uniref:uncharacterized protein n=1 Tax=Antedon mediterranea TaxID=105859 RepID=UPI003AF690EF
MSRVPVAGGLIPEKSRIKRSGLPTFKKPAPVVVENDSVPSMHASTSSIPSGKSKMMIPQVSTGKVPSDLLNAPKRTLQQPQKIQRHKSADVSKNRNEGTLEKPVLKNVTTKYNYIPNSEKSETQTFSQVTTSLKGKSLEHSKIQRSSSLKLNYSTEKPASIISSKLPQSSGTQPEKDLKVLTTKMQNSGLKPRSVLKPNLAASKLSKLQPMSDKKSIVLRKRSQPFSNDDQNTLSNTDDFSQNDGMSNESIKKENISKTTNVAHSTSKIMENTKDQPVYNKCNRIEYKRTEPSTTDVKEKFAAQGEQRKEELMSVVARLLERKKSIEIENESNEKQTLSKIKYGTATNTPPADATRSIPGLNRVGQSNLKQMKGSSVVTTQSNLEQPSVMVTPSNTNSTISPNKSNSKKMNGSSDITTLQSNLQHSSSSVAISHVKLATTSKKVLPDTARNIPGFNKIDRSNSKQMSTDVPTGLSAQLTSLLTAATGNAATGKKTFGFSSRNFSIINPNNSESVKQNDSFGSHNSQIVQPTASNGKLDKKRTIQLPMKKQIIKPVTSSKMLPSKTIGKLEPSNPNMLPNKPVAKPGSLRPPSKTIPKQAPSNPNMSNNPVVIPTSPRPPSKTIPKPKLKFPQVSIKSITDSVIKVTRSSQQIVRPSKSKRQQRPLSSTLPAYGQKLAIPQLEKQKLTKTFSTGSKKPLSETKRNSTSRKSSFGFNKVNIKKGQSPPSCRIVKPVTRPKIVNNVDPIESENLEDLSNFEHEDNALTDVCFQDVSTEVKGISNVVVNTKTSPKLQIKVIPSNEHINDRHFQPEDDNISSEKGSQHKSLQFSCSPNSSEFTEDNNDIWNEIAKESQMISKNILLDADESSVEGSSTCEEAESNISITINSEETILDTKSGNKSNLTFHQDKETQLSKANRSGSGIEKHQVIKLDTFQQSAIKKKTDFLKLPSSETKMVDEFSKLEKKMLKSPTAASKEEDDTSCYNKFDKHDKNLNSSEILALVEKEEMTSLDDDKEFEQLEMLMNFEVDNSISVTSESDSSLEISFCNITDNTHDGFESETEGKTSISRGQRARANSATFLSKSAPPASITSELNNSFIEGNLLHNPKLQTCISDQEHSTKENKQTLREPLGFEYIPPYAINIPTSKNRTRDSQTCPTSPTFNWFKKEQNDNTVSDVARRHSQPLETPKTAVRDFNLRRLSLPIYSSFTCPSTPSFGQQHEHFMFPINEEGYYDDHLCTSNYDVGRMLHNLMGTDLDTHVGQQNERGSSKSSINDSRDDSLQETNKADWRLEPEELQHHLERVKAEREKEDTPNLEPNTVTRRGSRSLPRPRSWNGMTDSATERARQMGMIKNARGRVAYQDGLLETHLDQVDNSKRMAHIVSDGKDHSPGSPTELVWPSFKQNLRRKRCETVPSVRTINHVPGIVVTGDASHDSRRTSGTLSSFSTRSSEVFDGPRSSTPCQDDDAVDEHLKPLHRRRSNSLTRAIDEGRLDIADEPDLRPLDIENDFHLISQITEMNQKMLITHSRSSSPQNERNRREDRKSSNSNIIYGSNHIPKPTKKWSSLKESKIGLRSAPASTRITPVSTPLGSPGLKHKCLKPANDSYSTLTRVVASRTRSDSLEQSDVERRHTSRSKEKRKQIRSLLLDHSNLGISSPDLIRTHRHSGLKSPENEIFITKSSSLQRFGHGMSATNSYADDLNRERFITKSMSLQRFGQGISHKPVTKMNSDSLVVKQGDKTRTYDCTDGHKPLTRVSGVLGDLPLRSSSSNNDVVSEKLIEDQLALSKANLEGSSDSSSLTSFESSSNLSQSLSQPLSCDLSNGADASNLTPFDHLNVSTGLVLRRPKGRNFPRPKSTPIFDLYRCDSPSSSSRESSRNMDDEKPSLKDRPPKPRRAPRRSKSDLGGKNTIKAALKAAERAAMKEAAERELIEKAANEILLNAERLTQREESSRTLPRRDSESSMLTSGDSEEAENKEVVKMRTNRNRGLDSRPVSDLGPMNFDFALNGESTPPRTRKGSIPIVLHKVDSPRPVIKRSQSTPGDLDKKHLYNASNQLLSNGTVDHRHHGFMHHSLSTDTLAEDMCITTTNNMTEEGVLVYGEALWDHVTMDEDELAFKAGDVIGVTDLQDKEWWWGEVDDQEGWFPASFVRIRVNQSETAEEHFEKLSSGQFNADDTARPTSMSFLSKRQVRTNVVMEILNTEKDYNKHLKDLCEGYVKQARKRPEMFSEEIIQTIFGNIEDIYVFQCRFLRKLTKRINQDEPHKSEIGSCFLRYKDGFSIYAGYCSNHSRAITELRQLLRRQRYKHFFEACRLLQAMIEIRIDGFLLTPVQRICKYPLQLAELLKYTPSDHPDYDNVKQALETMRNVAFEINEQKRLIENIEKIAQWQKSIEGWEGKDVLEVSTQSLHSGEVFKISHSGLRRTGRVLFLFDHQLILCKRDILWRSQLVYKNRINLDYCSFQEVVDTKDIRNAWKILDHECGKTYIFCTKSPEEKQKWMKSFHRERVLKHEEEERGSIVSSSAREAAMKNAALTEKPIKPSDTLLKRKVPLMPYEYQHEIIKTNVKRMVLPRGISSNDGCEVDTSKKRLLNWFFKGKW